MSDVPRDTRTGPQVPVPAQTGAEPPATAGERALVTSRRGFFAATGATGVAAVLAACGGDGADRGGQDRGGQGQPGTVLATTDQVEVGGGYVAVEHRVVVTQPAEGTFRAFSAVCTHQGCLVRTVQQGVIICPCHGSQFSVEDGSVVVAAPGADPATQGALPEVPIEVTGDQIIRAG